jgi:hypothetical protein
VRTVTFARFALLPKRGFRNEGGDQRVRKVQSGEGQGQCDCHAGGLRVQRHSRQRLHQSVLVRADLLREEDHGRVQVSAERVGRRKRNAPVSFSMFSSTPPYTDLIFQDATTQLKVVHPSKRHYAEYLGGDFLRARRIVDCHAGSASISASITTLIITSVLALVVVRV